MANGIPELRNIGQGVDTTGYHYFDSISEYSAFANGASIANYERAKSDNWHDGSEPSETWLGTKTPAEAFHIIDNGCYC